MASKVLKESMHFKRVSSFHPSLPSVIKLSIGSPTPEKIANILQSYKEPNHFLIGGFLAQRLVAIIGFEVKNATANIRHIAVLKKVQKQGTGKQLIDHLVKHFSLVQIKCETDDEGVGFYNSLGFVCKPFQNIYGARYTCVLSLSKR